LDLKTKEKNPPKQESLVILEMTVHRVGEKAENQGEIHGSRKPSVLFGFLRQKKGQCIHPQHAGAEPLNSWW
jgi:hypothetical protein